MKVRAFLTAILFVSAIVVLKGVDPSEFGSDDLFIVEYEDQVLIPPDGNLSWIDQIIDARSGILNQGILEIKNSIVTIHNDSLTNSGRVNIFNSTINFDQDLLNGGFLNVYNSTMYFYHSNITNSGYFNMTDIDGDATTPFDASKLIMFPGTENNFQNYQTNLAIVNMNRSYLEGVSINQGTIDLRDLEMNNCSIRIPQWSTSVKRLRMEGNGTGTAIETDRNTIPIDDISISNYEIGLDIHSSKDHRDLNVENCSIGLKSSRSDIKVSYSKFINNAIQIISSGDITLHNVEVINGSIDFNPLAVTAIQTCSFKGMDRISNISNGVVHRSVFTDCEEPIYDASGSTIVQNKFIRNNIAVSSSQDCVIYHNSFINNMRVVLGPPTSTWYNDAIKEGNHYDSYDGVDDGSSGRRADDGIGDTEIPYLARDPYPLLQDEYWLMPDIPEVFTQYEVGSDIVILNWDQSGSNYILQRSRSPDFSSDLVFWSTTETNFVIRNSPNSTNYFRVRAFNGFGSRGWSLSEAVKVNQKPLPPEGLEAVSLPEGEAIHLTWKWVGEDVDRAVIMIKLGERELNPRIVYHDEDDVVIGDLENGLTYTINMISVDQSGLISDPSEIIEITPSDIVPPLPPRNIIGAAMGNNSVKIEWSPPLNQDLWGYIIYRKDPILETYSEIARVSKGVLQYEDQELQDNTTYEYGLASVDDDGPISRMSDPITITTDHFNQRPIFTGTELILYLVEDEGPLKSGILNNFSDPDGDDLRYSLLEFFPFFATITDGYLWIIPDKDQAGEGYVQIMVSDGEVSVTYLIGIIVESMEDPPRDIAIIYPVNGSVLLPGASITMESSGYDPDSEHGDLLNVTWSSDKQGILHLSTQSLLRAVVELDPGIHEITLRVEDRSGNVAIDRISVVVSLWGWGEMPWSLSFLSDRDEIDVLSQYVDLELKNDSPLILRFNINGKISATTMEERSILVGPRSKSQITLQLPEGLEVGKEFSIHILINTQTLNGTYGGDQEVSRTFTLDSSGGADDEENVVIAVLTIISMIALTVLGAYLFYTFRLRTKRDHKGD